MSDNVSQVLRRSVTADDYSGVIRLILPYSFTSDDDVLPDNLPRYWGFERDEVLLRTQIAETMWGSAISIACAKIASASWEVQGDIPLRVKHGQELLLSADLQRGWVPFISKHLQSFLLTDNGAFIEIVRQSTAIGSKIVGLIHLDSQRCLRTGDPERPVVYKDLKGRMHELRRHEVIDIVDMPESRESFFGTGHCAASRAYKHIVKMAAIESYVYEKVSGRKIKEVHFVSGVNATQVANFKAAAESQADAKGLVAYMGAVIVPVPGERAPEVATVPLAEFPDGFNRKEEFDISILAYADALGVDVQDLQPLTGRPLGTATQSEVLSDKAQGKGLAAWKNDFIHDINMWVLPDLTTMVFIEKDWRDKQSQANYNKTIVETVSGEITAGIINTSQALQVLVDENVVPKEFIPVDETVDTNLSDEEKPGPGQEEIEPGKSETQYVIDEEKLAQVKETETNYVDTLLENTREMAEKLAKKIAKRIQRGKK